MSVSISTPWCSISSSTGSSGRSMSSYTDSSRGSRSISGQSRSCSRRATSAPSAAYSAARSTGTWLNVSCLRSPARDVFEPDRVDPEVTRRDRVEVVPRRGAVEHVGLEHRVVAHAGKLDAVVAQHMRVELEMVSHLGARRILEQRAQSREHAPTVELRGRARHSRARAGRRRHDRARRTRRHRRSRPACSRARSSRCRMPSAGRARSRSSHSSSAASVRIVSYRPGNRLGAGCRRDGRRAGHRFAP